MRKLYEEAEIYLTECTHPRYKHLRYLGLDTKCDPTYLGSSVVLKWWIQLLGRKHFKKVILERITGTMSELCSIEQKYILKHDAVRDPNYFNMNGGKANLSVETHTISMEYTITPVNKYAQDYLNGIVSSLLAGGSSMTHNRRQLLYKILSMCLYGFLKYGQESFEFCRYTHYGNCTPEDTHNLVNALTNCGWIDTGGQVISMSEKFIGSIPENVYFTHFKSLINNYN